MTNALTFDQFLLILRIAMIAVLYLFILQVVLVSRRDLNMAVQYQSAQPAKQVIGHLTVMDSGTTKLNPGRRFDIFTDMTLGRGPTNTVILESTVVSGENTRIYYENKSLWIEDLGSKNGTFVNEQRLTSPRALKLNDVIRVGDVRFKITA